MKLILFIAMLFTLQFFYWIIGRKSSKNLKNSTEDYLQIPAGEVLNYVCMDDAEQTPIVITPDFSYFTKLDAITAISYADE